MTHRWLVILCFAATGCGDDGSSTTPHAVVIGIDGVRSDALEAASTPAIDALILDGLYTADAFAGGEPGRQTEQRTLSGPGWSSILTGVWADKHGVEFNDFEGSRFEEYPHFFHRIREENPEAYLSSFVTWTPIHDEILPIDDVNEVFSPVAEGSSEADQLVTAAVVAHLAAEKPDVVFVHLDSPDAQGHRYAFSPETPEYLEAIAETDAHVAAIVDAIRSRPSVDVEDWLIVIVSDHGGIGNLHGGQSTEERTIPLIVSGGDWPAGVELSPGPGQVAVAPTVLQHLGIPIDPGWGWDGEPVPR